MSTRIPRRSFLRAGAAAAALPFPLLFARRALAGPFGDLVPDPNGILDLPAGFTYRILEERGADMDDGYRVPGRHDGMACFPGPNNTLILMRNHECSAGDLVNSPYKPGQMPPPEAFDPAAMGGVTRMVIDATTYERISSNLVLAGTVRNCAGGMSPWGWLSCEENTDAGHGYVFVCPTDADTVQAPQRIPGYGRFNHEAATVDPATNIAYLTEDRGDSCLYRFVPADPQDPFVGTLQALRVVGQDNFDTSGQAIIGQALEIAWVDIDEPDPAGDTVRVEAQGKGAAIFARGEGIWFHDGVVYICSTSGGPAGAGQIFRLVSNGDRGTLELIAESTDAAILDAPDNITVAPWGDLFMAEDGGGDNYIRGLTPEGLIFDFARNAMSDSELAGVCFSPDGNAMFVNIQRDGVTLVVTGPFSGSPGGTGGGGGSGGTGGDGTGVGGAGAHGAMNTPTFAAGGGCGCTTAGASEGGAGAVLTAAAVLGAAATRG